MHESSDSDQEAEQEDVGDISGVSESMLEVAEDSNLLDSAGLIADKELAAKIMTQQKQVSNIDN